MAIELAQDAPILELLVDRLLSHVKSSLHGLSLFRVGKTLWALDMSWHFTNAAIVSFHSLCVGQETDETVSEHTDVRILATRARSINPNNIASQDTKADLMAQAILLANL